MRLQPCLGIITTIDFFLLFIITLIRTKKANLIMTTKPSWFYLVIVLLMIASCTHKERVTENVSEESQPPVQITLAEVTSPDFPDAALEMLSPAESGQYEEGKISFEYNVKNYQLGTQTLDAEVKQCANSAQGQHIHLILNNEPYSAHYTPNFAKELPAGHYVALSFISRSYHESLKHYGAYNLRQFTVGQDEEYEEADLTAPHLFYSRPKGTYAGADTEKVLLDFYLINTDLSADGNQVRATINGESFMIDQWAPYFVEGLPMGETTIKLELLDSNGSVIPGPFNSVVRTITLVPDAA